MSNLENPFPMMPPKGHGGGGRFESADLNIEELRKYLLETKFENFEEIIELLQKRYFLGRKESIGQIESSMTRVFRIPPNLGGILDPENKIKIPNKDKELYKLVVRAFLSAGDGNTFMFEGKTYPIPEDVRKAFIGKPLSGQEPSAVLRMTLKTLDDRSFDLRIFKTFNRNQEFRFEFILNPLEK